MDYFELLDFLHEVIKLFNYDYDMGSNDFSLEEYIAQALIINGIVKE